MLRIFKLLPHIEMSETEIYFTIQDSIGLNHFYYITINNLIKYRVRNKWKLIYKQENPGWKYKISEIGLIDFTSKSENWLGVYLEKSEIFQRNPIYSGKISLHDLLNILKGEKV